MTSRATRRQHDAVYLLAKHYGANRVFMRAFRMLVDRYRDTLRAIPAGPSDISRFDTWWGSLLVQAEYIGTPPRPLLDRVERLATKAHLNAPWGNGLVMHAAVTSAESQPGPVVFAYWAQTAAWMPAPIVVRAEYNPLAEDRKGFLRRLRELAWPQMDSIETSYADAGMTEQVPAPALASHVDWLYRRLRWPGRVPSWEDIARETGANKWTTVRSPVAALAASLELHLPEGPKGGRPKAAG